MLSMREYFNQFKTIVVLGASSDPYRTSYHIARYLQQNGYRIVPVNPNEEEVLDEKSYPTLADLPQDIEADAVVSFRHNIYSEGREEARHLDTVRCEQQRGQGTCCECRISVRGEPLHDGGTQISLLTVR